MNITRRDIDIMVNCRCYKIAAELCIQMGWTLEQAHVYIFGREPRK